MCIHCAWDTYAVDIEEMQTSGKYGYAGVQDLIRLLKTLRRSKHITRRQQGDIRRIRELYARYPNGFSGKPIRKRRKHTPRKRRND